ncbi:MAG: Uncharacterized UPF0118 membrane protein, partial [uncultured Solirubrobacteraceae bacterium]
ARPRHPERPHDPAGRARRRRRGAGDLPDLPAAQADHLDRHRRLHRDRPLGADRGARAPDPPARPRHRDRLRRPHPRADRARCAHPPAAHPRGQRARRRPAGLRHAGAGVRALEPHAARPRGRLRHHGQAPGAGPGAARPSRQRRGRALRREPRARQLDLRARHDPHPVRVPGGQRGTLDQGRPRDAPARPGRAAAPHLGADLQRDRRLRRGRARPGDRRGRDDVRRAARPRGAVRRPARRARRAVRPHPARRRDDRRGARRDRDAVLGLPDGHDRLGDLGDRLPADREHGHPAADPEARGQHPPVRGAGRRPVRLDAVRRARRPAGDSARRVDPDHHPRVPPPASVYERAGARSRRRRL